MRVLQDVKSVLLQLLSTFFDMSCRPLWFRFQTRRLLEEVDSLGQKVGFIKFFQPRTLKARLGKKSSKPSPETLSP